MTFERGDLVRVKGLKTEMKVVGPSAAMTSHPCLDCEFYNRDMKRVVRAFLTSSLELAVDDCSEGRLA